MNPVGERSAGNPHATFDERGVETDQLAPPHGTALLLDSTDAVPIQETPHRSAAAWDLRLGHRPNDLIQCHVPLFFDQPQDKVLVLFHSG
jgi:hypothetical protein